MSGETVAHAKIRNGENGPGVLARLGLRPIPPWDDVDDEDDTLVRVEPRWDHASLGFPIETAVNPFLRTVAVTTHGNGPYADLTVGTARDLATAITTAADQAERLEPPEPDVSIPSYMAPELERATNAIRRHLARRELTTTDLASALDLTVHEVRQRLESAALTLDDVTASAAWLGLTVDDLIGPRPTVVELRKAEQPGARSDER